jgi:cobalt-zinc-cadmium efflux system outer membrane protein
VQNSLRNLERIERTLLPRAREVRDITDYSYRRGEASFLEFLDAQRAYSETRQSLNDSLARLAQSLYELDAATGATTAGMMR